MQAEVIGGVYKVEEQMSRGVHSSRSHYVRVPVHRGPVRCLSYLQLSTLGRTRIEVLGAGTPQLVISGPKSMGFQLPGVRPLILSVLNSGG